MSKEEDLQHPAAMAVADKIHKATMEEFGRQLMLMSMSASAPISRATFYNAALTGITNSFAEVLAMIASSAAPEKLDECIRFTLDAIGPAIERLVRQNIDLMRACRDESIRAMPQGTALAVSAEQYAKLMNGSLSVSTLVEGGKAKIVPSKNGETLIVEPGTPNPNSPWGGAGNGGTKQ